MFAAAHIKLIVSIVVPVLLSYSLIDTYKASFPKMLRGVVAAACIVFLNLSRFHYAGSQLTALPIKLRKRTTLVLSTVKLSYQQTKKALSYYLYCYIQGPFFII